MRLNFIDMKKLFVLFILFACTITSDIKAQDTLDVVVDHFCDCITQKQDSAKKNNIKLDAMIELQTCLLKIFVNDIEVLKAKYGKDFKLNAQNGEMVGEEIGTRAALHCPNFIAFASQSDEFMELVEDEIEESKVTDVKVLYKTGTVKSVKEKPGFVITIKDGNKEEQFLVVKNGSGVMNFIENHKTYIGKEASIKYAISEIYNAEREEFELKKEILSIEILK